MFLLPLSLLLSEELELVLGGTQLLDQHAVLAAQQLELLIEAVAQRLLIRARLELSLLQPLVGLGERLLLLLVPLLHGWLVRAIKLPTRAFSDAP